MAMLTIYHCVHGTYGLRVSLVQLFETWLFEKVEFSKSAV